MIKFSLIAILFVSIVQCSLVKVELVKDDWHYDLVKCTTSFQAVIDSLFSLTLNIETNLWDADPKAFVGVLEPLQSMLSICTNVNIDAVKYSECISRTESVLPSVGKLVQAIHEKSTKDIIFDASEIGLELLNGISFCIDV